MLGISCTRLIVEKQSTGGKNFEHHSMQDNDLSTAQEVIKMIISPDYLVSGKFY